MTEEIFDIVDESDRVIGTAVRSLVHGNPALIHRSVHVHVFNSARDLFLQKRGLNKETQPGKWDTSVGGHVASGEAPAEAALREMHEELGISGTAPEFLYRYLWRTPFESEMVSSYFCRWDGPIRLLESEIDDGRFWNFDQIKKETGSGKLTPNFEEEWRRLKEYLETKLSE
ncbi:MAG TPA: NUDIX domain-containing protein [Candidatus Glassbacteria bacterium]|nr:NUDIX domain-containing protein [Candidatus Glassbacteria bacterium]